MLESVIRKCIVHEVSPWWRPFKVTLRVSKLTLMRAHYCFVFVLQDQAKIQGVARTIPIASSCPLRQNENQIIAKLVIK